MGEKEGKRSLTRAGYYRSLDPRTGAWQTIRVVPGKVPERIARTPEEQVTNGLGFDLSQKLYNPDVRSGDVVTEEQLRLGHLVAHLRRGAWHPLREV
jgi:hypothetical protein